MEIGREEFVSTFTKASSGIYYRLKKSLLPFQSSELPDTDKKVEFLTELHRRIRTGEYFPSPPRGYLILEKYNGVPRYVPVLTFADNLVYYFCLKQLTREAAFERAANTYGGFQSTPESISREEQELAELEAAIIVDQSPYSFENSLDPRTNIRLYKSYQKAAFIHSRDHGSNCFVYLDIANFYDSINLDLLEKQMRAHAGQSYFPTIDLLFVLLRFWNRSVEGYGRKSVGLPLEEIGDNSRILANYFLQGYDHRMVEYCQGQEEGTKYLRYADDQILMAPDEATADMLLSYSAGELQRIGLSINAGKVKRIHSRDDFDHYWCFDAFTLLRDEQCDGLNDFAVAYFELIEEQLLPNARPCKTASMLKAIVNRIEAPNLSDVNRRRLVDHLLNENRLMYFEDYSLRKILSVLTDEERRTFDTIAQDLAFDLRFNRFAFVLNKLLGGRRAPAWLPEAVDLQMKYAKL